MSDTTSKIDPATIKAGGRVDVTLKTGERILGVAVKEVLTPGNASHLWIEVGNLLTWTLRDAHGATSSSIASIDAYTPPEPPAPRAPWWDREDIWAVLDEGNGIWTASPDGGWSNGYRHCGTSPILELRHGPCTPLIRAEVTDEMVQRAVEKFGRSFPLIHDPAGALRDVLEIALGLPGGDSDE